MFFFRIASVKTQWRTKRHELSTVREEDSDCYNNES